MGCGRYDGLVGMFSGKDKPAVGVSIGIERVFALLEEKYRNEATAASGKVRENEIQVCFYGVCNRSLPLVPPPWCVLCVYDTVWVCMWRVYRL